LFIFLWNVIEGKIHILTSESISLRFYWKKVMAFPEQENHLLLAIHKFEPCLQEINIMRQSIICVCKNKIFNPLELRKEI